MKRESVDAGKVGGNPPTPGANAANTGLVKVGGVCAILAALGTSGVFIAFSIGGEVAGALQVHRTLLMPSGWLLIAALMLKIPAGLGFFWAMRRAGTVTWLGLAAWLVGTSLVIAGLVTLLAVGGSLRERIHRASGDAVTASPVSTPSITAGTVSHDPLSAAEAYYRAYNAQDGEALEAIFAEDIVLSFEPGFGTLTGKEAVLRGQLDEISHKPQITLSDPRLDGNTVRGRHTFRADPDVLYAGTMEVVVEEGKITRLKVTMDEETLAVLLVVDTVGRVGEIATKLGVVLMWGIGVAVFALVGLRVSVVPAWVAWLGLLAALFAWLSVVGPVADVFRLGDFWGIYSFGFLAFILWFYAMGVAMIARPTAEESVIPQERLQLRYSHTFTFPNGLTKREVEVLRIIAAGRTNRQIADELLISERTVAQHARNIFNKMGVANRAEAVASAARSGLLQE